MRKQTVRRCSGIGRRSQSGIALLMLVIAIVLAVSGFYFSSISLTQVELDHKQKTREALRKAKQALINYAVMHGDPDSAIASGDPGEYGYLPCPFINVQVAPAPEVNEGDQQLLCGGAHENSIGLLPWRTLETELLRDGSGNCLWYVVSGSYKNNTYPGLLNQDSIGMLQIVDSANNIVVGNNIADRPVAMIIAPGYALDGQIRNNDPGLLCGNDGTAPAQFLDNNGVTDNADLNGVNHVPDEFLPANFGDDPDNDNDNYNDEIITISREEIWQAVYNVDALLADRFSKMTEALAECLAAYAGHADNPGRHLPYPAPFVVGDYRSNFLYGDRSSAEVAVDGYAGRFPFNTDDSNGIIGLTNPPIQASYMNSDDLCRDLTLADGTSVNLKSNIDLYRKIYMNWKDHFFYALSEAYEPDNTGVYTGCGGADCITVNGNEYAAIVIFAGRPQGVQSRIYDDVAGVDQKQFPANYLEDGNDANVVNAPGNQAFNIPVPPASNDVVFCLSDTDPPTVVQCI